MQLPAEEELCDLLAALVRLPSHPGVPDQERAVVELLADFLRRYGLAASIEEVVPGRPNLVCSLRADRPGRHLLLCGHSDTVPLNAGEDGVGFSAEIRAGRMYGRGTADMKGGLCAMAAALVALRDDWPAGTLTLGAVIDEEMQSLGAEHLIRSGFRADGAIVGEPTGNRLELGHKGLEWLEIHFVGRAAHGGHPEAGINAIDAAARFIQRVRERVVPRFSERRHPLLGPPTINLGTIRGGDQPSTVAAGCVLTVDRRSVPGESYREIAAELSAELVEVAAEMPGLATEIRRMECGMATMEHVACAIERGHPLASAIERARAELGGPPLEPGVFPAWTDASLLSAFAAIPSVVLGPGDLSLAHSPRESVALAEVFDAARLYAQAALRFCVAP